MDGKEVMPEDSVSASAIIDAVQQQIASMALQAGQDDGKMSIQDKRRARFFQTVTNAYDFMYVESAMSVYYKEKSSLTDNYRLLTDFAGKQMAVAAMRKLYPHIVLTDKQVEEYRDLLQNYTQSYRERINNNLIKVGPTMYWNVEDSELTNMATEPCMRTIFDADPIDDIKLDINKISEPVMRIMYKNTLKHLEATGGVIMPYSMLSPAERTKFGDAMLDVAINGSDGTNHLNPYWTWADYDLNTFNDLLKASASIFMRKKPNGAFILIGRTRNGKSSYLKMHHTMLGTNNTSSVRLADLDDSTHFTHSLMTTMMNAPDEDDEGKGKELLKSQSYFKSISAHSPILVKTLFSNKPMKIATDYMSFYPMNKLPEWEGRGKEACMKRSLILMFNNDLSRFDNSNRNFEKETYTEDFFSFLLGVLLAIAHYYRDKQLEFSDTMKNNQEAIAEEVDSATAYVALAKKYFNGYQVKTLIDDYILWCVKNEFSYDVRGMKEKLKMEKARRRDGKDMKSNYYEYKSGDMINYNVFKRRPDDTSEPSKLALVDQCFVPDLKCYISTLHSTGNPGQNLEAESVIARLEALNNSDLPEQLEFKGEIEDGDISDDGELL